MIRIILLGYMGAGKTTIGRALARHLGYDFYDLDWYIEDRFHSKVADIFANEGESRFREIEQRMLHELGEFENVVIACGGGTACFFDNMAYMNQQAETIWLTATPDVLETHLRMGKSVRPLLLNKTPEELRAYIEQSLQEREPYYSQAKHKVQIDVIHGREQIQTYVQQIEDLLHLTPRTSEETEN